MDIYKDVDKQIERYCKLRDDTYQEWEYRFQAIYYLTPRPAWEAERCKELLDRYNSYVEEIDNLYRQRQDITNRVFITMMDNFVPRVIGNMVFDYL